MTSWLNHTDAEATDLLWDDMVEGTRVRWVTPTFVKRGTVEELYERSIRIHFDGEREATNIPDGKWYWTQWRLGNVQEHMVSITGTAPKFAQEAKAGIRRSEMSVAQAAAQLGTDKKTIRRWLRSGQLKGNQVGGTWFVKTDSVEAKK